MPRLKGERVRPRVVAADPNELRDHASAALASDVRHQVDREGDRLARAGVRQSDVGGQDAVREARQGLLSRVRMDGAHTAEMSGVERLQQVKGFRAAYLAHEDAVGPMAQRRAEQVRDGDGRQGRLLAEGRLRAPRLEPHQVRFVDRDLGGLFDQDDAIRVGNCGGERVQQCRLSGAGSPGDQDVAAVPNGLLKLRRQFRREAADVDQIFH